MFPAVPVTLAAPASPGVPVPLAVPASRGVPVPPGVPACQAGWGAVRRSMRPDCSPTAMTRHPRPGDLPAGRTAAPSCGVPTTAAVVRIVDGDTVILRMDGRPARVRLIGIDAPETWPRHDCFGAEATRALRRLLPAGSPVYTTRDIEPRDPYGRLLLYLWTAGKGGYQRETPGDFVNARLIRAGFARAMPVPPDTSHASVLRESEHTARHTHAGLWQACA